MAKDVSDTRTFLEDLINPQVMADMISAKLEKKLKFLPYAKVDTTLQGRPGNKVTVPVYSYIGAAVDVAEGEEIPVRALGTSTKEYTIKKYGVGTNITDEAALCGYGDPVGNAANQLTLSMNEKAEIDVVDALYEATTFYTNDGILSYNSVVNTVDVFEEEINSEKVEFIHPKQTTQLRLDPNFISKEKYGNDVMVTGEIGMIANTRIVPSKRVKKNESVTAVQGVYTLTIGGTIASGDKITVAGVDITMGANDDTPTEAATSVAAGTYTNYTATSSGAVVTFTEKTGEEGTGKPTCSADSEAITLAVETTTQGAASLEANKYWLNPVIKLNTDAETEDDLPALTIYLKRDTNVETERISKKRTTEVTADKIAMVSLTNESRVVIAKNLVVPAV